LSLEKWASWSIFDWEAASGTISLTNKLGDGDIFCVCLARVLVFLPIADRPSMGTRYTPRPIRICPAGKFLFFGGGFLRQKNNFRLVVVIFFSRRSRATEEFPSTKHYDFSIGS
jgi:hypothetical protein